MGERFFEEAPQRAREGRVRPEACGQEGEGPKQDEDEGLEVAPRKPLGPFRAIARTILRGRRKGRAPFASGLGYFSFFNASTTAWVRSVLGSA